MLIRTVYVVAAQHGTEVFGLKILAALQRLNPSGVVAVIAHPEAIAKKRLYIETDLNRSYGSQPRPSKETMIASRIMKEIARIQPDLILDLHTARSKVGKVGIMAEDRPELQQIAAQLGMGQVVLMPSSIHYVSLIGQHPRRAISLEFGVGLRSDALAEAMALKIAQLVEGTFDTQTPRELPIYEVQRTITKQEAGDNELVNYRYYPRLGGYPFLAAKGAYTDHAGFLALRRR